MLLVVLIIFSVSDLNNRTIITVNSFMLR
uniref:Uncharacterized protein n=1 Tax=Tetranychus urticae TaxID=32264 RepID=T1JQM4_TETUR